MNPTSPRSRSRHVVPVLVGVLATGLSVAAPAVGADDLAVPATAGRQAPSKVADDAYFSVQIENDKFTGTDRHYTNGIRLTWMAPEDTTPEWAQDVADAVPLFPSGAIRRWGLSLGHSIFTPSDIQRRDLVPNERPYAGWLYAGLGFVSDTGQRLDSMELLLGVVGPSAHGETIQNDWHTLIGVDEAKGWDNQLEDEPGVMLAYERKVRAWRRMDADGLSFDVTPHVGFALGNVLTYGAAGGTVRIGMNLPDDYGPPRIRPSLTGTSFFLPTETVGWYVFAGVEGRAVARNIFLDGNTFHDSHSVDKRPFVADVQGGVAITIGNARFAYTHVLRTKEFEGQDDLDHFGSFSISIRF